MPELLFMQPYLKEVIWGGTRLRDDYGYETDSSCIGEAWVISATAPGYSTVKNGVYKGNSLKELWDEHRELFGNLEGDQFPLLVKVMDAARNLSIQVHPDDSFAQSHEKALCGKAEAWYIMDTAADTDIIFGHTAKTHENLTALVRNCEWKKLLRILPLHKGDFLYNPPGTVHGIRKGALILEIQQNCDITYRLYDYDRLQDGKKRPLHIDKSLSVITCPQDDVCAEPADSAVFSPCGHGYLHRHFISCPYFSADLWVKDEAVSGDADMTIEQIYPFLLVDITNGTGSVNGIPIQAGDHFVVPSDYGTLQFNGNLEFVTSHV